MSSQVILGDYILYRPHIGKGSFSKIYRGKCKKTNKEIAIKKVSLSHSKKIKKLLKREIECMKDLDHPNIVKLIEVIEDSKYIYIILEYCKVGDLSKFLNKRSLKERIAKVFLRQIAQGLFYLRQHNIVHRDLKPHNILLTEQYTLKITDFGLSKFVYKQQMFETLCGTPLYMAPEILNYNKYTDKADLWSIGVILYEMLTGKTPYEVFSIYALVKQIEGKPILYPHKKYPISKIANDLLFSLLEKNPNNRISWDDFFNHEWLLRDINPIYISIHKKEEKEYEYEDKEEEDEDKVVEKEEEDEETDDFLGEDLQFDLDMNSNIDENSEMNKEQNNQQLTNYIKDDYFNNNINNYGRSKLKHILPLSLPDRNNFLYNISSFINSSYSKVYDSITHLFRNSI